MLSSTASLGARSVLRGTLPVRRPAVSRPGTARRAAAARPGAPGVAWAYTQEEEASGQVGSGYARRLPGVHLAYFDPLNLAGGQSPEEINRWRERFNPLFDRSITGAGGPAINHFQQVPAPFWQILTLVIAVLETRRARIGWMEPTVCSPLGGKKVDYYAALELVSLTLDVQNTFRLRPDHAPGDYGWDPLGLFPTNAEARAEMQTKELSNGRLAMLAMIPFVVREELTGKKLWDLWPLARGTSPVLIDSMPSGGSPV